MEQEVRIIQSLLFLLALVSASSADADSPPTPYFVLFGKDLACIINAHETYKHQSSPIILIYPSLCPIVEPSVKDLATLSKNVTAPGGTGSNLSCVTSPQNLDDLIPQCVDTYISFSREDYDCLLEYTQAYQPISEEYTYFVPVSPCNEVGIINARTKKP